MNDGLVELDVRLAFRFRPPECCGNPRPQARTLRDGGEALLTLAEVSAGRLQEERSDSSVN